MAQRGYHPHPSRHIVTNSCVAWLLSSGLAGSRLRGVGVNLTPGPTPNEREWVSGLQSSLVLSTGVIRLCVCVALPAYTRGLGPLGFGLALA